MKKAMATVLMSAYNSEDYIQEAIDSILNQTFRDFELLIINDGSSDRTEEIILKNRKKDDRIKYVKNEQNLGLIESLNKGFSMIETKYIMRMDTDDIALPKRLEKQIKYLEKNADIAVLGTQSNSLYLKNGKETTHKRYFPTNTKKINTFLLFTSPIIHPSVAIRTQFLKENSIKFQPQYKGMEDYALWTQIANKTPIRNLPDILINYRLNPEGVTQQESKNKRNRDRLAIDIYHKYLSNNDININKDMLQVYRNFIDLTIRFDEDNDIEELRKVILSIKDSLREDFFDINYFDYMISKYFRINALKSGFTYRESMNLFYNIFEEKVKFDIYNKTILLFKILKKR